MNGNAPAEAQSSSSMRRGLMIGGAVLVAVVLAAGAFVVAGVLGGDEADAAEVTLQSLGATGSAPFSPPVAPPPSATLSDFAQNGPPAGVGLDAAAPTTQAGYLSADGSVPGVFGGTLDESLCDVDQLIAFLTAEPAKATAWASAVGIGAGDVSAYIQGLTAANLGSDTRVLDHGFADDELQPTEAVLQRGSAVLVDRRGVPRVNCYSGNPLKNPTVVEDEVFVGNQWTSFQATKVLVITPAPADAQEFVLFDVATGTVFRRPAGTTGAEDSALDATASPQPGGSTRDLTGVEPIDLGSSIRGEVNPGQPERVYSFEAPDGAVLTLTASNDRASVSAIAVRVRSNGEDATFFRVGAGGSEDYTLTLGHDGGGPFEILISEGPGAFEFQVAAQVQDDGGQGGDAGDEFANAFEIESGQTIDGVIADRDAGDRYVIPVEGAPELVLEQTNGRASARAAAFFTEFTGERLNFERVNAGANSTFSLLLGTEDEGLLEIFVSEGPADYTFTASLVPQNDGGQPGDAPGDLASARTLDSLADVPGEVGQRDAADYYLFDATAASLAFSVAVDATAARAVAFDLAGPDGTRIKFLRVEPGTTVEETFDAAPGETYRLIATEGRGRYTFSIQ